MGAFNNIFEAQKIEHLFGLRCVKRGLVNNKKVCSVCVAFLTSVSTLNLTRMPGRQINRH